MDFLKELDNFEYWPEDITAADLDQYCKENNYKLSEYVLKELLPEYNTLLEFVHQFKNEFEDVINRYSEILEIVCRGCSGQDDDDSNYNTCPRLMPRPKSNKPQP